MTHSVLKTISISSENKLLQQRALTQNGEETTARASRTPRESARSGECRWRKGKPVSNPSARSMCDPRNLNRCCASAVAGPGPERRDHRHRHTPRSVPGGSETYCSGEKHNQSPFFPCLLTARALLPRNAEFSFLNFSEMQ